MRIRLGMAVIAAGAALVVGACEDVRNTLPPIQIPDGGGLIYDQAKPNIDLPPPGFYDFGGIDMGGAPIVTITAPKTAALITGTSLTVDATVATHPGEVSIDVVTLLVMPPTPGGLPLSAIMNKTKVPQQYEGTVDITALTSQPFVIYVTALDLAKNEGVASTFYRRDAGPKITVISPKNQTYKGSAALEFSVSDQVFSVDPASAVVGATVQGVNIAVAYEKGTDPPTYSGTIDFHAPQFKVPLAGKQSAHITARNHNGTQNSVDAQFTVDEQGPTIMISSPIMGAVVGGVMTVHAKIDDDFSGVADNSVFLVVQNADKNMNPLPGGVTAPMLRQGMAGADDFAADFDFGQLNPLFIYPLVSVRADDTLGNHANTSEQVILDLVGPSLSLDPPFTRVRKPPMMMGMMMGMGKECSRRFDPLGDEAMSDADVVSQVTFLHARVADNGSIADGLAQVRMSQVDPVSVEVYMIPATAAPLIVDTDGDGICDDFNPDLVPKGAVVNKNEALKIPLTPIPLGGAADYTPGDMADPNAMPLDDPKYMLCGSIGDMMAMPPMPICKVSGLSYIMQDPVNMVSQIYTIGPIFNDPLGCMGLQLDLLNKMPDGPACVAVRAKDKVGNRSVSAVLRICVDKFNKGVCGQDYKKRYDPKTGWTPAAGGDLNPNLPDCTGSIVGGKPNQNPPCAQSLKLNTGMSLPAFPAAGEYYLFAQ